METFTSIHHKTRYSRNLNFQDPHSFDLTCLHQRMPSNLLTQELVKGFCCGHIAQVHGDPIHSFVIQDVGCQMPLSPTTPPTKQTTGIFFKNREAKQPNFRDQIWILGYSLACELDSFFWKHEFRIVSNTFFQLQTIETWRLKRSQPHNWPQSIFY